MTTVPRVFSCIKRQMGISDLLLIDELEMRLGADDLDYVELAMLLEEEFKIDIDDEEFRKLETVNDVCDYIDNVLRNK